MGKMNEISIIDWIKEEQDNYKDKHNIDSTFVYNDLIDMDKIDDDEVILFCLVQTVGDDMYQHIFKKDDIEVINGVSLTYKKKIAKQFEICSEENYYKYRYITVPFDKVLYSYYETRPAK